MFKFLQRSMALAAIAVLCATHASAVEPWVRNASRPFEVRHGLDGRHLSLWASHGRYYDQQRGQWRWQRSSLFCTNEDLFTQTIVVPYLMPMLEQAGAVVFSPRERDWQRNEIIVDNDPQPGDITRFRYSESYYRNAWKPAPGRGFAFHGGAYRDGENPFEAGTARMAPVTRSSSKVSEISYEPVLPEAGRYAVYVSYKTIEGSIDDARYTVWHRGVATEFRVNQQMGGSTWVYLGTFDFDTAQPEQNRVVLSNLSDSRNGYVTADAVRFGGGMGNISRGGKTSTLPRCLEGARYFAQWAGMPYEVYSPSNGQKDYNDDINVRSLMTNRLLRGSAMAPDSTGLGVPIELAVAIHSDAGHTPSGEGIYGTLSICTTKNGAPTLGKGQSREASLKLATALLDNTTTDLTRRYGEWTRRKILDRNYSETRLPVVPSAILETLAHQNFGDMRYGLDPNFRFHLARSIYKTLLRYLEGRKAVVQPLPPDNFHIEQAKRRDEVRLSWQGIIESGEPTSEPTGYVLYMAVGNQGFDNGTHLRGTSCTLRLKPGIAYSFRIAATNDGGESFPTEVLSAYIAPKSGAPTVAIVNGFNRLAGPAQSNFGQGFSLDDDPGITYGRTAGWLGRQTVFDTSRIGIDDSTGLGYSSQELAGSFVAGNDFNYVRAHAEALAQTGLYNIVSTSAQAVANGDFDLNGCVAADIILGLQRADGQSPAATTSFKTFPRELQQRLRHYTMQGGNLLVSGAFVASDQTSDGDRRFLAQVLKCAAAGTVAPRRTASLIAPRGAEGSLVSGLGLTFSYYSRLNERHYAATRADLLQPTDSQAFPAMAYADGMGCAAVAYPGATYRTFTMGFPLECVTDNATQAALLRGIMAFLTAR